MLNSPTKPKIIPKLDFSLVKVTLPLSITNHQRMDHIFYDPDISPLRPLFSFSELLVLAPQPIRAPSSFQNPL